ncbi:HD domain-containing protein [soil metagenome]
MPSIDTTSWPARARHVDDLVAVLVAGATTGEPTDDPRQHLSQLDHGLQCADLLRIAHPDDTELQMAGLLHDIGHTLAPGRAEAHGQVAGAWLQPLLGERVGALVELHVPAKRYLVTVDPTYRSRLSPGSVTTLGKQGDILDATELAAFDDDPHHRDAITLRRADERAKVPGLDSGDVAEWIPALEAVAATHGR